MVLLLEISKSLEDRSYQRGLKALTRLPRIENSILIENPFWYLHFQIVMVNLEIFVER